MDQQMQQTQDELRTTQQTIEHQQKIIDSLTVCLEQYVSRWELIKNRYNSKFSHNS